MKDRKRTMRAIGKKLKKYNAVSDGALFIEK